MTGKEGKISFRTRKAKELLACLFFEEGRGVKKDMLMERLWPETEREKASVLFHTTVSYLRKALLQAGASEILVVKNQAYAVDISHMESDIGKLMNLNRQIRNGKMPVEERVLETAESYRECYMYGEDYTWLGVYREYVEQIFLQTMGKFSEMEMEKGEFGKAVLILEKAVEVDSYSVSLSELLIEGLLLIAYPAYGDVYHKLKQIGKICRVDWNKAPLSYAAIEGGNRLLAYLMGEDGMDAALFGKAEWFLRETELHPMFIREELAEECAELIKRNCRQQGAGKMQKRSGGFDGGKGGILQISGSGGRRFLARHVARHLNEELLLVDGARFQESMEEGSLEFQTALFHEVFLQKGMLCIYGITGELLDAMQKKERDFLNGVVLPFWENGIGVILCTGAKVRFPGDGQLCIPCVELKEITRAQRETVFRGFAEYYGLSIDCAHYSIRYRLSASEIAEENHFSSVLLFAVLTPLTNYSNNLEVPFLRHSAFE